MKKFLILCTLISSVIFAEEYAVIVNAGNGDAIDASVIKDKFLITEGAESWSSGSAAVSYQADLSDPKNKKVFEAFAKKYLGMDVGSYNQYWDDQKSKGRTVSPNVQNSFKAISRFIKRDANGIGYVPATMARGVKVVDKFEVN